MNAKTANILVGVGLLTAIGGIYFTNKYGQQVQGKPIDKNDPVQQKAKMAQLAIGVGGIITGIGILGKSFKKQ